MDQDLTRYHRQYLFHKIGLEGQKKISKSRVTLIGCGALGTVIASALVRGGVGFLRIVDRDFIELNNLQRQVLFDEEDIRQNLPKAVAAKQKLEKINHQVKIDAVVADANYTNIESLIEGADLVMDGSDNFEVRYVINDACVKAGKPWIYGGCVGDAGMTLVVIPKKTPCLACLFQSAPPPEFSPSCDTAGIISPIVNIISSLQVTEALKVLMGKFDEVNGGLYSFNVWNREAHAFGTSASRDPECPVCEKGIYEYLKGEKGVRTSMLCGRNAVQISRDSAIKLDFPVIADKLKQVGVVSFNNFMLKCALKESGTDYEITLFPDGRAIIKGTSDIPRAKSIYAKYISV